MDIERKNKIKKKPTIKQTILREQLHNFFFTGCLLSLALPQAFGFSMIIGLVSSFLSENVTNLSYCSTINSSIVSGRTKQKTIKRKA